MNNWTSTGDRNKIVVPKGKLFRYQSETLISNWQMANDCHPCVPAPQNYNWAGWCILGVVAPVRGVVVSTPTPKKISFVHRLIGSTTYTLSIWQRCQHKVNLVYRYIYGISLGFQGFTRSSEPCSWFHLWSSETIHQKLFPAALCENPPVP